MNDEQYILIKTDDIDFSTLRAAAQKDISGFFGEYRWLSNFWSCTVYYDGIAFPSVEHAYVYSKNKSEANIEQLLCMTAGEAKKYGRTLNIASDFEQTKVQVMHELVLSKFTNNEDLKQKLINTGICHIQEYNTWNDTFWGVTPNGRGLNHLGLILMNVRALLSVAKMQHIQNES